MILHWILHRLQKALAKRFAWSTQYHRYPSMSLSWHYSSSPQWHQSQNDLHDEIAHRPPILVAEYERRHRLAHSHMPHMPHMPTYSHHTCTSIRQSLHGHYADASFGQIQIYHARSMFTNDLSWMAKASTQKCHNPRWLDLRRDHLSLGFPIQSHNQQQDSLHRCNGVPREMIPYQPHSN
jgi:hypothetical protein